MKTKIYIYKIVKETEKAILANVPVRFNANASKPRDVWFPKSVIGEYDKENDLIEVEGWFLQKASEQNAFHGYEMNFVGENCYAI